MTIEERARAYHDRLIAENEEAEAWAFDLAYETGAKSQRAIDIDKACEWLESRAELYGSAGWGDAFDPVYTYDSVSLVEAFRKAMEE